MIFAMMTSVWLLVLLVSGGFVVLPAWSDYLYPALFLLCGCTALRRWRIPARAVPLRLAGVFVGALIATAVLRGDLFGHSSMIVIKMAAALLVAWAIVAVGTRRAVTLYIKTFRVLMIGSLLMWALGNLFRDDLWQYAQNLQGFKLMTLYWAGYYRGSDLARFGFYRNGSIFWEPGVFGVMCTFTYLVHALYIGNIGRKWFLYFMCVVSSWSMGSIVIFVPLTIYIQMLDFWSASSLHRYRYAAGSMAVAAGVLVLGALYAYAGGWVGFFEILFHRDIGTDSSIGTRMMGLRFGSIAAMQTPWIGHGADMSSYAAVAGLAPNRATVGGGLTSSVVSLFYEYGIVVTTLYLVLLWRACGRLFANHATLCFFALVGCLMVEPLAASVLFLLVLLWPPCKRVSGPADDKKLAYFSRV